MLSLRSSTNNKEVMKELEIDTDKEYLKVLLSLGLLTDDDDWSMYLLQELEYEDGMLRLDKYKGISK